MTLVEFSVIYHRVGDSHNGYCSDMDCEEDIVSFDGIFLSKYKQAVEIGNKTEWIKTFCFSLPGDDSCYLRKIYWSVFDYYKEFKISTKIHCCCGCSEERLIKNVVVNLLG